MDTLLMPPRYSLQRLVTAWGVTVLVHAALLTAAAWIPVTRTRPLEIIRISLRPGGGGGAGGAPHAVPPAAPPSAPAPAPVEAVPPIAPPVPPPAAVPPQVTRRRPPVVARPQAPRQPRRAAPQERAAPAPAPPEAAVASAPGVGEGASSGHGTGTGAGLGGGSGTGVGTGSGSGTGAGAGPDADQRAFCVYCPEPGYPLLARRHGWRGSVDVALVLLADGRVDSASVRRSSGYSILDEEAVAAARRSRFQLAQGVAAPVHGRIEYRFELRP